MDCHVLGLVLVDQKDYLQIGLKLDPRMLLEQGG